MNVQARANAKPDWLRVQDVASFFRPGFKGLNRGWSCNEIPLRILDAEITATLQNLPTRQIVSNHDSLGYFVRRYELEVVGVVIPGGSTLSEPSSADLADLVAVIESSGAKTIFTETTESSTLTEAVAAEGEGISLVELYVGSLGDADSGAATYVEMLRTDARLIQEALTP